jgi:hypothetical protein
MEASYASKLLISLIATTFYSCAVLLSARKADEERHRQMVYRMDAAHVFVTNEDLPKTKPYQVLGDLKYSEPFSSDAIDKASIHRKLKALALAKYPEQADAVIKENSDVESSGQTEIVTVTGEVIQFDSSADRALMHNMWEMNECAFCVDYSTKATGLWFSIVVRARARWQRSSFWCVRRFFRESALLTSRRLSEAGSGHCSCPLNLACAWSCM